MPAATPVTSSSHRWSQLRTLAKHEEKKQAAKSADQAAVDQLVGVEDMTFEAAKSAGYQVDADLEDVLGLQ